MKVLRVRRGDTTFYGQLLFEERAVRCLDPTLGLPETTPLSEVSAAGCASSAAATATRPCCF